MPVFWVSSFLNFDQKLISGEGGGSSKNVFLFFKKNW